jgi:hypothetical protein
MRRLAMGAASKIAMAARRKRDGVSGIQSIL